MTIQSRNIDYADGSTALQARIAWDDAIEGPRPGVLVSHAWRGRTEFENDKAVALARLGYVGFALDLYGKGITGSSPEENSKLMQPFLDDREMLKNRLLLALDQLRSQPETDGQRTAAIGFCFGGLCVLDLARSGADLGGVVSFHGLFRPPETGETPAIKAKVLVLHGWDDPMAPPDQVLALAREMSERGADWQLHAYGNTMHAFTNPAADDPANGLRFEPDADRRSWQTMQNFLSEIL